MPATNIRITPNIILSYNKPKFSPENNQPPRPLPQKKEKVVN